MTRKSSKLCVRNKTNFKKYSSSSSSSCSSRRVTLLKKAYELSTLCEVDVCIISYGPDGELTTWPKDQSKVRDMAERFSQLNDLERSKKSTNLSQVLRKKIKDDNKFSEKVLEMKHSLERRLRMLQDQLDQTENPTTDLTSSLNIVDHQQQWTQPLTNHLSSTELDQTENHTTSSLLVDHQQQWIEPLTKSTEIDQSPAVDLSTSPNNFSIFLYNHDNGVFTKLANSELLLGAEGFGGLVLNNNIDDLPPPPPLQVQTLNPLSHFGHYAACNQTPSFGDPLMSSFRDPMLSLLTFN